MVVTHPAAEGAEGAGAAAGPGRRLVVHADGTRVCSAAAEGCVWRVEKEGFAAVAAGEDDIAVDLGASVAIVVGRCRLTPSNPR